MRFSFRNRVILKNLMAGIFRGKMYPVSGRLEWIAKDETYDFYQEIARSGYADMLHDTERNVLFHKAIQNVVAEVRNRGERVHVLDIGTGTGLLAMMAAKSGADNVTACEAFYPMAETARKIIAANGLGEKIKLVEKRSTDMIEDDMVPGRANIVVAEVFDTELIGEGALRTFKEAHERLLMKNARVIPSSATIYVQPIHSEVVERWTRHLPLSLINSNGKSLSIRPSEESGCCPGNNSLHDLQLDQLPTSEFMALSEPVPIFRFNFERPEDLQYDEYSRAEAKCLANSTACAVLLWWELDMDGTGQLILSMKPNWDKQGQWRDHWMQAIYYLPQRVTLTKDVPFWILGRHDEHSLWFDIRTRLEDIPQSIPPPICNCGFHSACSRGNLGYFNDQSRYQAMVSILGKIVPNKVCLCISDCSLLSLIAVKLGAQQVYVLQEAEKYHRVLSDVAKANSIQLGKDLVLVSDVHELPEDAKIDCVFGDPFFFSALLPWHNLHFWYKVQDTRQSGRLADQCHILPKFAHIKALALETRDLWKIRAPVGRVEGFDLRLFDGIAQKAIILCDDKVEPHALWEYPGVALGSVAHLATYDLESIIPGQRIVTDGKLSLKWPGKLNAIAFWVDWQFQDGEGCFATVSSGLKTECEPEQQPQWNWYQRQGVYFFEQPFFQVSRNDNVEVLIKTIFSHDSGDISFEISVNS